MNERILHQDVQDYIDQHLKSNITQLILKGSPFNDISIQELAHQIVSKQKCEKKLPSWFQTKNIYYPPKLNIEQTSSELTAEYKSSLVSGKRIIDITGGFGVDTFYFSKRFETVTHCEINVPLSEITTHNFKKLGVENVETLSKDGLECLRGSSENFDVIYVDPSRRNDQKGKVFLLRDCEPNIPDNIDVLFEKSEVVLLKNSPILDIKSAINELKYVKEIHIVAINNDVKELLFLMQKGYQGSIEVSTLNFKKEATQEFTFTYGSDSSSYYSLPQKFIYEPNAAILKSGGFHHITSTFDVYKLHQHSHLYTSEVLIDFPGRTFQITEVLPYDKKKIKRFLKENKANITTRNFPKTVAQIRKELKIKDGGDNYLFFTTNMDGEFQCIFCKRA
ncbi:MAG: class I SAM-dependent methyltransferase [Flavobacteriaceae bacterium]